MLNKKNIMDEYYNQNDYWPGYDPYKGMTDKERMMAGCLQGVALIVTVIVVMLLCALLGSCKPQERIVTIATHSTDTLLLTHVQRDSIYMHDSIHVREKGDTVTIERWHTRWRDRWHSDTVYISKTDSVPRPYPVEVVKEVAKPLTWWQQARMFVGGIVIFGLIIFAAVKIIRRKMTI